MKQIQLSLVNDKAKKIIASCDEINIDYVSTELIFNATNFDKVYDLMRQLQNGSFTYFMNCEFIAITLLHEIWAVEELKKQPQLTHKEKLIQRLENIINKNNGKIHFCVLLNNDLFEECRIENYHTKDYILCKGEFAGYNRRLYVKTMTELYEKIYNIICDEIKTKYNEKLTINDFVFIPLTNLI